ncbi:MAG: exodeoxyribonuclease VII small subunit [Bacteroidetes bacterium]|nr:exodeoxyribonuclease VII small subunit [Bacteroidota bacterium]
MSEALDPNLTYDDAVRELQEILSALQSGELGIDELTSKLQRAGLLLDFCQGKLTKTEAEVQAVLKRLGLEGSE